MAATISINFTTPEEVFSSTPSDKKSVSAKVLADVLGGGQVGGGYVQRTGATMTGYLTLASAAPIEEYHAAHKSYVDTHAFTRRYNYTVGISLSAGTSLVFGRDNNSASLYFFDATDTFSINTIQRYVDVYRDGILQVFGDDYVFRNINTPRELVDLIPPKVEFTSPLLSGTNVAIHVGNKSATPTVLGVASLSANPGSGIRIGNYYIPEVNTGDLSISAYPLDFVASQQEMRAPTRNDKMVSPISLSAFPLIPKAFGLYRRSYVPEPYVREQAEQKYGNANGEFTFVKGFNLAALRSGFTPDGDPPETFTCFISSGVFTAFDSYAPRIEFSVAGSSTTVDYAVGITFNDTKTPTKFKFTPLTLYFSPPDNVDEVSIVIY